MPLGHGAGVGEGPRQDQATRKDLGLFDSWKAFK